MKTVKRAEIIAAFAMLSETWRPYLDLTTGRVVYTTWIDLYRAGAGWGPADNSPWRRGAHDLARQIAKDRDKGSRYLAFPDPQGRGWWDAMQAFGTSLENPGQRRQMLEAMCGPAAFQHCRDAIDRLGLAERWEAFLDQWYEQAARQWCQEHKVAWPEDETTGGPQGNGGTGNDASSGSADAAPSGPRGNL